MSGAPKNGLRQRQELLLLVARVADVGVNQPLHRRSVHLCVLALAHSTQRGLQPRPHGLDSPVLRHQPVNDDLHLLALRAPSGAGQHGRKQLLFFFGVMLVHGAAKERDGIAGDPARLRGRLQQRGQRCQLLQLPRDADVAVAAQGV